MPTVLFFPGSSSQKLPIVSLMMGESWGTMRTEEWKKKYFFNWWQILTLLIYNIFHATRQHAVTTRLQETFHPISYSQQIEHRTDLFHRGETGPIQRRVANHHLRKNPSQSSKGCLMREERKEVDFTSYTLSLWLLFLIVLCSKSGFFLKHQRKSFIKLWDILPCSFHACSCKAYPQSTGSPW